jgi:hypothetical protein
MTTYTGNLIVTDDINLPDVTAVTGHLIVYSGATLTANALTTVHGYLSVGSGATLTVNALTSVKGSLSVREGATLTASNLTTAYGVPGRELTRCPADGYVLWLGDDGLYYAGCRRGLNREQALERWEREDDRAKLFTGAILG